jgi:hypothetical protein
MAGIYVPPRYRVRFNGNFRPEQAAVQVVVELTPSGVFGIQDGRTLRRAESGPRILFDQKTGEVVIQEADGQPVSLDPVSLDAVDVGIGRTVMIVGNQITWNEAVPADGGNVEAWSRTLEEVVHRLLAVLPMLGYRRWALLGARHIVVKQQDQVVGWAEL